MTSFDGLSVREAIAKRVLSRSEVDAARLAVRLAGRVNQRLRQSVGATSPAEKVGRLGQAAACLALAATISASHRRIRLTSLPEVVGTIAEMLDQLIPGVAGVGLANMDAALTASSAEPRRQAPGSRAKSPAVSPPSRGHDRKSTPNGER